MVIRVVEVMGLLVGMKVRFLVKALITARVRTTEWLLACVDPQVGFKVKIKREFLVADFTLVWFFAGVD